MKSEIKNKLKRIRNVWRNYILEYKYYSTKLKFNSYIKTNYFSDLLGYFDDTLDIVFTDRKEHIYPNYSDKFSYTISFLQAIYVQQDFIQEMLEIFRTGVEKGDLKKNINYSINRELRNELVGHPIRKISGELISSTLFSYQEKNGEIEYLRYHKDKNFKFESKNFKIIDIQKRHSIFINYYLDIVLEKLEIILNEHLKEIEKVENVIKKDFNTVLKLTELYFERIFKSDFLYDKDSLMLIYKKRNEHTRYQNLINDFYKDLKIYLNEIKLNIKEIFEPQVEPKSFKEIKVIYVDDNPRNETQEIEQTYHYELGKLSDRNVDTFDFHSGTLKSKCTDNQLVLSELENMELNIDNEIEYYSSLNLIINTLE